MGNYVDGFVAPVPSKNIEAYRKISEKAGKIWMEYGALSYIESVSDDVESGEETSFPQSVNLEKDEVVVFSWITYESREHRDEVLEKVMSDKRMLDMENEEMPFDGKRMMWGGFKNLVSFEKSDS
ncbi:DUF1428 domain-containing protein [Halobacteriovorax sp. JY17]|uniref:DUF1428 domain-containing protein n=1 Tax=Halobacteriovorax sp. JY17 TaxID=2014617 RepID=UPI000C586DD7|nr:DUF1428 domain-containing protein [Halobacteriovorax sp. JY17]PIK13985.1 MAG: RNA signal recognition particle [Halobacteriovorax sp. JY17]